MIDSGLKHRLLLAARGEAAVGLKDALGRLAVARPNGAKGVARVKAATPIRTVAPQSDPVPKEAPTAPPPQKVAALSIFEDQADIPSMPSLSTGQKTAALAALDDGQVKGCTKCRLSQTRTNTVFGEGDVDAKIVFIGEGPGENEDQTGRPFVGKAGQLLDKMIVAMGIKREDVFIVNIVKCRPPDNRVPIPDEVATCTPYLVRQLEVIQPRVIVTLGLPAVKYMTGDPKLTMGRARGQWRDWRGIKLMPTYHPAFLLRSYTEANRKAVWDDLRQVMHEVGLGPPK